MKRLIKKYVERLPFLLAAMLLFVLVAIPAMTRQAAAAGQMTHRSVQISSSVPNASGVTYTVGDNSTGILFPTNTVVKGFKLEVCTLAVGTCATPTSFSWAGSGGYTLNGWTDTTAFTKDTTSIGDCDGTNVRILCLSRAGASSAESTSIKHQIIITGVNNPNLTNTAFFIRMTTYSTSTYTVGSILDQGTVASATTISNLTVNAAVAEILNFCVGNTGVDDATTSVATSCADSAFTSPGTSVNLGTLDSTKVNVTPVTTNCSASDCSKNGVAMVRSNALYGTAVYYASVVQSGSNHTRDLRISGDTCEATADNTTSSVTDSCFNQSATQSTIAAGTEKWGMTVAGDNCGSSGSYTCVGTATGHMTRTANYDGIGTTGYTAEADQSVTTTTANGFAWDEGGTAVSIATSVGAGTPQIDDEALILKFAATPSITTPFGAYTAKADFICVSAY